MKICSYSIVHYAADYLPYALHSVSSIVDSSYIFYTKTPSHNFSTSQKCPEKYEDIKSSIKHLIPPDYNLTLIENSSFQYEGQHRDWAKQHVIDQEKPDILLVLDYDEIWPEQTLKNAIDQIVNSKEQKTTWRINFTHFYKSFNWVCRDQGWPDRIFDLTCPDAPDEKQSYGYISKDCGEIYHFGYAIKNPIMVYKLAVHGHHSELRPRWFWDKYKNWEPSITDVHPTNEREFWTPEPFDKTILPEFMRDHPFYNMERIN